ncbi:MAG: 3-isopropylmalate dehydratase large subunit [Nitrososphaerota archaeon]|nr:3-isopropylmalate dehydratase large subunit [Nitrososphaerota archaeon]
MSGRTVADKIWEAHTVASGEEGTLLYIDRHMVHEVTSPVAFEELRKRSIRVRRPDLTVAVVDHNVPTADRNIPIKDELSAAQIAALDANVTEFGIPYFDYFSPYQGISHVVAPELGLTLPGTTLVCGDSHTPTHGALGALAFGIGTSEVALVLAHQSLWLKKPKNMEVRLEGMLSHGVTSKDVALAFIGKFGIGAALGHTIEYTGEAVRSMSVEERMTICNMATEAGARAAIVSPDQATFDYIKGRPFAPADEAWEGSVRAWKELPTDGSATFDRSVSMDVSNLEPQVTWGTNPSMVSPVSGSIPDPSEMQDRQRGESVRKALRYMDLKPGTRITGISLDRVFIGSCTNARLSDLASAAKVAKGRKVSPHVRAMVVPGSQLVKRKAERLGLHSIFLQAGFEWRNSGCSLCIGMNEDRLSPGERAASTSNRNFENRQGTGGRTHLVSPAMAAAAAIEGHFVDVRDLRGAS